jgi:hypothetical protein
VENAPVKAAPVEAASVEAADVQVLGVHSPDSTGELREAAITHASMVEESSVSAMGRANDESTPRALDASERWLLTGRLLKRVPTI